MRPKNGHTKHTKRAKRSYHSVIRNTPFAIII